MAWLPVNPHLETSAGTIRAGAIATLVDVVGGGLAAIAAQPDWIATADLTLHLVPRVAKEQVMAHGRVLRHGRTTVVIEVRLTDVDDAPLGLATMSFAVLPRRDGNLVVDQNDSVRRMTMATEDSGLAAPLNTSVGLRVLDPDPQTPGPGTVELPLADYVRNSLGALQGGMIATVIDAATVQAVGTAVGPTVETVDLQITYLALARIGPIRTRAELLDPGGRDPGAKFGRARIEVYDTGADDRLVAVARAVAAEPT